PASQVSIARYHGDVIATTQTNESGIGKLRYENASIGTAYLTVYGFNLVPDQVALPIQGGTNRPPVAQVGADQKVKPGASVTLDGAGSIDLDGAPLTYRWIQEEGPEVTLNQADTATPQFIAPMVSNDTTLVFKLI